MFRRWFRASTDRECRVGRRLARRGRVNLRLESLEDRTLPSVSLVSINSAGTDTAKGQNSINPSRSIVSADGRFAVFQSNADDVTANGAGGLSKIFVRDLQTGTTSLVNV